MLLNGFLPGEAPGEALEAAPTPKELGCAPPLPFMTFLSVFFILFVKSPRVFKFFFSSN